MAFRPGDLITETSLKSELLVAAATPQTRLLPRTRFTAIPKTLPSVERTG